MSDPVAETRAWVADFVVRHGLCPFAAQPLRRGLVDILALDGQDHEAVFFGAWAQVQRLVTEEQGRVDTILLVIPATLENFPTFLDFAATLEEALRETGADRLVQLAHFHPAYVFAGTDPADPGNRTNRSPWPVIQLLRVASVARAVAAYPAVEDLPARNVALLRRLADDDR